MRRASLLKAAPLTGDPDKFLNLSHIDDAASAAVAALDRGRSGGLYLVSDDRPIPRREFYELAAEGLKAPAPRFSPAGPEDSNKRVKNARMHAELCVTLAYPDITTGVPASIADGV
jgi:nucleoside-diphosphate-sugar epimerase